MTRKVYLHNSKYMRTPARVKKKTRKKNEIYCSNSSAETIRKSTESANDPLVIN